MELISAHVGLLYMAGDYGRDLKDSRGEEVFCLGRWSLLDPLE